MCNFTLIKLNLIACTVLTVSNICGKLTSAVSGVEESSIQPKNFIEIQQIILSFNSYMHQHWQNDNILVYSQTPEEHLQHLCEVFEILRTQKFFCRLHKCHFNDTEMKYLGHLISADGVRPDPEKVEKVKEWPRPTTVQEVRAFLGLANYFRKFMRGYSQMVSLLTDLTRTKTTWNWTDRCTEAFQRVKYCLTHAPVLRMPDFSKPFEVVADASKYASGGVLLQEGQPIAFDSIKFNKAELNYTVSEQEMLASMRAVQTWRCYLEG